MSARAEAVTAAADPQSSATTVPSPFVMLGVAAVPVCVDDSCVVPAAPRAGE
jgi:hypothetical protein